MRKTIIRGAMVCLVSALTACGGGGGEQTGSATLTVSSGSVYVPTGVYEDRAGAAYSSQSTTFGKLLFVDYDFGTVDGGVAYLQSDPSAYMIGMGITDTVAYTCVSQGWIALVGVGSSTPCPNTVVLDSVTRTLTFNNAQLVDSNNSSSTITTSGQFAW